MPDPPATLAGRYRIVETLGSGGMGTVYGCRDEVLDTDWAVKEVAPPSGQDQATHARQFLEEARILARLRHPGLPRVVDFFEQDDRCYLVMDRIRGRTLREILDQRGTPLDTQTAVDWLHQVLDVVGHLHGQQPPVIVRDIAPTNLMVDEEGQIRLIDFGLARLLAPDTKTSPMLKGWGSPGYAAPEQYGQGATDVRTDLYAVGATAWLMLTGEDPPESVTRLLGRDALPAASSLGIQVPARLDGWLQRALALRPEERFQDAREMKEALPASEPHPHAAPPTPAQDGGASGPDSERALDSWRGFVHRLHVLLAPHGWGRLPAVPEPFEGGLVRQFGLGRALRRIECWWRPVPVLSEEEMDAACTHARLVALRSFGLLPSTLFVILGAARIPDPVAVQAVAAGAQVVGYRSVVFLPVDLEGRSPLDGHVGERFCNTNDLADFVLNLRIALGRGLGKASHVPGSHAGRSHP